MGMDEFERNPVLCEFVFLVQCLPANGVDVGGSTESITKVKDALFAFEAAISFELRCEHHFRFDAEIFTN